jgi:L-malate glycosyltransferase
VIRIHQVLATLGYGDAIGHEVLGIQRVLRGAGYESEIFVETADHRLEPQTHDYRELVDFSHRDNLLLPIFRWGRRPPAPPTRYRIGWR